MKPYDVLVAGEINPDLILSSPRLTAGFGQRETLVESLTLTIGSSSVIFACGAARLGLKVEFIGVVGDDLFGHFMLDAMRARGVEVGPVIIDPAVQTGLSVILSRRADRAILTYPGAIAALHAEMIGDDLLNQARHLHVGSYFLQTYLQEGLPALFNRAHALGLTISLDTNWDPSEQWRSFDDLLAIVDVFLPNENEALAIARADSVDTALEQLSQLSQTIAIKQGDRGGVAQRGNERVSVGVLPVTAVDTVGAGDTFDAGFIYGYLNEWTLEKSLRLACVCGSLSTQVAGGTDGQPTLTQAVGRMAPA
jgi:sugar/nucleoside kinase (ribokinase family)